MTDAMIGLHLRVEHLRPPAHVCSNQMIAIRVIRSAAKVRNSKAQVAGLGAESSPNAIEAQRAVTR